VPTRQPGDTSGLADEFGDPLTPLAEARSYGNYYEFTRAKEGITNLAQHFRTSPWQVEVGGLVRNPRAFDLDDLRKLGQEERIYRLRCLEAWSMVIPWLGFPLRKLLEIVEPAPNARFVRFETVYDPEQMPGQNRDRYAEWVQTAPTPEAGNADNQMAESLDPAESPYVWPYVEALRLDEAMHDLTLLATGMYGNPLPPENGAPMRLVVPWKYGFKSLKAIVRIDLTEEQPLTFWVRALPKELGFYANVNPDVPHPRWSQGREKRLLGQDPEPILSTLPFNGYAEQVAAMYAGMDLKINF
jgi:sulfoxide reductase catalytic subunit YedY